MMNVIKKILGLILTLAGFLVVSLSVLIVIMECYSKIKWGYIDAPTSVIVFIIFVGLAGAGCLYGGVRLIKAKHKIKNSGNQNEEVPPSISFQQELETNREDQGLKSGYQSRLKDRCTLIVEDVFSIHSEGCIVTGVMKGTEFSLRERVWILSADGKEFHSRTMGLAKINEERALKVVRVGDNTRVGIWFKDIVESDVSPGCVITNIPPYAGEDKCLIENPMLKGLLAGMEDSYIPDIEELIRKLIINNTRFLVVMERDIQRDGFQAVFTDLIEMKKYYDRGIDEKKIGVMSMEKILDIVKQDRIYGKIIINPFSDGFVLYKNIVREWLDLI